MTAHILVPLDGSALAESILSLDVALARLTSSGITLLMAVPPPQSTQSSPEKASTPKDLVEAQAYLNNIVKRLEETGLQVHTEIIEGSPTTAITEYAEQDPGVWLVSLAIRRHERPRAWALGSVIERVLHTASKPVLLTRPTIEETGKLVFEEPVLHIIIVPLDGSKFAEEALLVAGRLADITGAILTLVTVIPPGNNSAIDQGEFSRMSSDMARGREMRRVLRYLNSVAERLQAEGLEVNTELVYGHPAEMILLTARRLHGDMIVMAAHGRRDRERVWLGGIAQKVVQGSALPVLLIRESEH